MKRTRWLSVLKRTPPRHKLYEIQTGLLEVLQRATADTSSYPENYSLWKIYDLQKELIPEPEEAIAGNNAG